MNLQQRRKAGKNFLTYDGGVIMPEQEFERDVIERLTKIESKIEKLDDYKKQVYQNKDELLLLRQRVEKSEKDLNALHENNRYLKRTTIAAIISAIISVGFNLIANNM